MIRCCSNRMGSKVRFCIAKDHSMPLENLSLICYQDQQAIHLMKNLPLNTQGSLQIKKAKFSLF
uniref:Uncharacterized protein n=1 Tax=Rhizophora mucronata TaxID=61149 RepID=A0A2P2PPK5_RHIMU